MEFELESQKVDLKFHPEVQTTQLTIAKMHGDIYMLINDSSIYKCVILYKEAIILFIFLHLVILF
jgi:hypothetical protein